MKIDRNNYEPYFIDYLEGTLDEKLVDDFLEFLQQNPDLKEELALFNTVNIEPEEVTFSKKQNLFKEKYDLENEFNNAAIAQIEGDISEQEKTDFENYIQHHPEKKKDLTLFEATKLKADEKIIFTKKNKLYHRSAGKTVWMWSVRVAAVLVIALMFYVLTDNSSNKLIPENQVAVIKDDSPQKEKPQEQKQTPKTQVNQQKEEPVKTEISKEKSATKKETKKAEPVQKQKRSLREDSRGRIESEDLSEIRISVEVPAEMTSLTASLEIQPVHADLGAMPITIFEEPLYSDDEKFLADVVIEKTGLDKLNLNKITKAGLNLVASISNEKFTYETNEEGKITEYSYDSRLLAFTIPSKSRVADDK